MDFSECQKAYDAVYGDFSHRRRLDSLLSRDECVALRDAYLASLPSSACEASHRETRTRDAYLASRPSSACEASHRESRTRGTGLTAFVVCRCGGELWGRDDTAELTLAAVMGHTLLHYGGEAGCGRCVKTGIVLMFRAFLLSRSADRGSVGVVYAAAMECISRRYGERWADGLARVCPGMCRQRAVAWCCGMEPEGGYADMIAGVQGLGAVGCSAGDGCDVGGLETHEVGVEADVETWLAYDFTALCSSPGVNLSDDFAALDAYIKGLATYNWFVGCDPPTAPDNACHTEHMLREQSVDSGFASCDNSHAGDFRNGTYKTAWQYVVPSFRYSALVPSAWKAGVHQDLLNGEASPPPLAEPADHWYSRVWHAALCGQHYSLGPLYHDTVVGKDRGYLENDAGYTGCADACACPARYHRYGLGLTLAWTRAIWCQLPCLVSSTELRAFGLFVDGARAVLRCGQGRHRNGGAPRGDSRVPLPVREACIGDLSQARCHIVHLLVWCAIDAHSAFPRPI